MINHNISDGYQYSCQICGSEEIENIVDLGTQPLADKLTNISDPLNLEVSYPLVQAWCKNCGLNQLRYICPAEKMFGDNYNYKTGVTAELVDYQALMAKSLVNQLNLRKDDLVCDLGSNDGTLLKGFKNCGLKIQGVEPTDIAFLANEEGIPTLRAPFGVEAAKVVVGKVGKATLATATNVFAHVQQLGDFINGLNILLKDNGYFCFENHYLPSIIKDVQYDTIYHEHLRSLSLSAISKLFSFYDFSLIDVKETSRYGGNIRVILKKGGGHQKSESIEKFLAKERALGLFDSKTYKDFNIKVTKSKTELLKLLIKLKESSKKVIGYSLPARAITLINYVGIDQDLLPYVVEQPKSLKLNKYIPGTRIPVLSNECLEKEKPDFMLVFAWHLKNEILNHLRSRGIKGKCIFPLPEVEVIDL